MVVAQEVEEDVVVLKDGTVFRGTIPDALAPGGAVSVRRHDGSMAALFWSEIIAIKRLPAGIPDSLIAQSFIGLHAGKVPVGQPGGPRVDLKGYQRFEDILFLNDGSILRGVQLNEAIDGRTVVWVNGQPKYVPESMIEKAARVERGVPDSVLIMTYVKIPKEWTDSERRIFTVFGGIAMPFNSGGSSVNSSGRTIGAGPMVGVEAGIQLWPGFRWLTNATYSAHTRSADPDVRAIDGVVAPETKGKYLVFLTGGEMRTITSSGFKLRLFAQVGMLSYKETGYDLAIPQTFYHLAGTVQVHEISASSFALCAGAGVMFGRVGADLRWIFSRPGYTSTTYIQYAFSNRTTIDTPENNSGHQIQLSLGVSIF